MNKLLFIKSDRKYLINQLAISFDSPELIFHFGKINCRLNVHFSETLFQPLFVFGAKNLQPFFICSRF